MEQFITLQHWREKERKREKKKEKEPVAFFYADARHVRASLYPSTIVPTIVELLFRNLRFAYLATTVLVHTRPHVHGVLELKQRLDNEAREQGERKTHNIIVLLFLSFYLISYSLHFINYEPIF